MKRPYVIAISSVSGGGKTTIIQQLERELANSKAVFFDDYVFDGPDSLIEWARRGADYNEWKLLPLINDLTILIENEDCQYILLEYPFAYLHDEMKGYLDLTIFLDTPLDVAMARRVLRDFNDATIDEIRRDMQTYLNGAREAYTAMLEQVKPNSDIVIDGNLDKELIVKKIKNSIRSFE